MRRQLLTVAALTVVLGAGGIARGGEYPPVIAHLLGSGVKVAATFKAPAGLTGYVVTAGGQPHVIYVTGEEQYAIVGTMLDADGNNLTQAQLNEHLPKPDYSALWQAAEKATWIAEGAKDPKTIVYALADPHCPYCHAFWLASQAYEKVGLQVRWIWVSYLHADGEAKVAAMLEAKDPAKAMNRHERHFRQGGIAPLKNPDPKVIKEIQANTRLMQQFGINGTPAILYKDGDGDAKLIQGMPGLSLLPQIFGLPEQKIDDPQLDRFR